MRSAVNPMWRSERVSQPGITIVSNAGDHTKEDESEAD